MGIAIDRLSSIEKPDLFDQTKRDFLQALAESTLMFEFTAWNLSKSIEKKLGKNYTRIRRAVLNEFWKETLTKLQQYGYLPPISKTIQLTCGPLLGK